MVFVFATVVVSQTNECGERSLIASVADKDRVPVGNLVSSDFKASYGHRAAKIVSSRYVENAGIRVVLLLDLSGSMRESDNKWRIAHLAASEFVATADKQAQVSFIGFGSDIKKKAKASEGRQVILDWLNDSRVQEGKNLKGPTALNEAITAALRDLSPTNPGDSIYVITDGGENASKEKRAATEKSLRESGVRLFVFLLAGSPFIEEVMGGKDLQDLARDTGGTLVSAGVENPGQYRYDKRTVQGIQAWTQRIEGQMSNFYLIGIEAADGYHGKKEWKFDVLGSNGRKRNDLYLAYPHYFVACSAQTTR